MGNWPSYERIGIIPIVEVFENITSDSSSTMLFRNEMTNTHSLRLNTFKNKGHDCVVCGIKGRYFAVERSHDNSARCHLNLYSTDENGNEVLMTKRLIIPRQEGGEDSLENTETICWNCANAKAKES